MYGRHGSLPVLCDGWRRLRKRGKEGRYPNLPVEAKATKNEAIVREVGVKGLKSD